MSATPTGQAQPVVSAPPPEAEAKSSAAAVPAKQELADLPPDADLRKKITHALQKAARAKGAAFVPVQELDNLLSHHELEFRSRQVLDFQTADELDEHKNITKKVMGTAAQLRESIHKAAAKLVSHLENMQREAARSEKKAATQKEKDAVAKAKAQAKKAADLVKKEEKQVPALFALQASTAKAKVPVLNHDGWMKAGFKFDSSKPTLLKWDGFEKVWAASAKVQMALSAYGGQYSHPRKSLAKGRFLCAPKLAKRSQRHSSASFSASCR